MRPPDHPELWRPIPGPEYEGYEASTLGNIRSLDKTITTKAGVVKQHKGKILNPTPPTPTAPYRMVTINNKNYRVGALILLTFDRPRPWRTAMARHLDDDHTNEKLSNLAWGSRGQNTRDSIQNFTFNRPWRYRKRGGST